MTPLTHRMNMVLVPEQDQVATVEESWPASNEDETVQASGSLVPWEPWCQGRGGPYAPNPKFSCPPPTAFMGGNTPGNLTVLRGHPGILRVHLLVLLLYGSAWPYQQQTPTKVPNSVATATVVMGFWDEIANRTNLSWRRALELSWR